MRMEKKKINMKDVQKVVTTKNKTQNKKKVSKANTNKKGNSEVKKKQVTSKNFTVKKETSTVNKQISKTQSKTVTKDQKKTNSIKKENKVTNNHLTEKKKETPSHKEIGKNKKQITPKENKKIKEAKKIEKQVGKKEKSKKANKVINIIIILLFIACIGGVIISISHIFTWKRENKEIEKQVTEIEQKSEVEEVPDSETVEVIEPVEEIDKANPYWDYIKMNLINVDFTELKQTNNEVAGWIQVNGTNINYPFVQTTNNDYYLSHAFNKSYNSAGWVFMDYRNNISNFNKNTIIYAHGRLDNTMFGSLKNIVKSSWIENPNNYIIKLSTEYENTLWQVFSVYKIPTTNDYLKINFKDEEEFTNFTNKLIGRSEHNFNTAVSSTDKILTLSTCYDDTDKVILHAKLIKREAK